MADGDTSIIPSVLDFVSTLRDNILIPIGRIDPTSMAVPDVAEHAALLTRQVNSHAIECVLKARAMLEAAETLRFFVEEKGDVLDNVFPAARAVYAACAAHPLYAPVRNPPMLPPGSPMDLDRDLPSSESKKPLTPVQEVDELAEDVPAQAPVATASAPASVCDKEHDEVVSGEKTRARSVSPPRVEANV